MAIFFHVNHKIFSNRKIFLKDLNNAIVMLDLYIYNELHKISELPKRLYEIIIKLSLKSL